MSLKKITITRKIELYLNYSEKEEFLSAYKKLWTWQNIVFKSANLIASHQYIQENAKDLFYFTDEAKVKLADIKKDEAGILTTSRMNTTYQVLSKQFKGEIPMSIITSLNNQIVSTFNKEKKQYFKGERALRNYRSNIPIPIRSSDIVQITPQERNYTFNLYGIKFRTNFGKDLSGNKEIFERSLEGGDYKLCDSSIQLDKKKIFLLATFQFDKQHVELKPNVEAVVTMSMDTPLVVNINGKTMDIGSKEEFLYRRLAIQNAIRRSQISARYNKGGKGIQKKIKSIEKFKDAEISYVTQRMHNYSKKLIDLCLKFKASKIVLANLGEVEEKTKEDEFLLRNWSYFGLKQKITYKAQKFGIEIIEG